MTLQLDNAPTDDPTYVEKVSRLIIGAVNVCSPESLSILRLDGWFGSRWLGFSHKVMGAFGVANYDEQLVVPPFVPNRITAEQSYRRVGSDLVRVFDELPLHVSQSSEENRYRKIHDLYRQRAFFWWSGASASSGRGAVMGYLPMPESHVGWYAGLVRTDRWRWSDSKRITRKELDALEERAVQQEAGPDR